jgi:hypothetical protein
MRNGKLFGFAVVAVISVCLIGTYARSQDKKDEKPAMGGMDDAAMKAMAEAAAPGPHHKALEPMAGNFKYVTKFRMDPAQDWMSSEGDYNGEMAMDGRYLMINVKGPMMGMNFMGMGCLGYDNMLQKFVAGWIDNMGTGIMRSEGVGSDNDKTITFTGQMLEPMTKKMTDYKYAYEIKSNDEFVMRWWTPSMKDGKMFESMTITYTRVK